MGACPINVYTAIADHPHVYSQLSRDCSTVYHIYLFTVTREPPQAIQQRGKLHEQGCFMQAAPLVHHTSQPFTLACHNLCINFFGVIKADDMSCCKIANLHRHRLPQALSTNDDTFGDSL